MPRINQFHIENKIIDVEINQLKTLITFQTLMFNFI